MGERVDKLLGFFKLRQVSDEKGQMENVPKEVFDKLAKLFGVDKKGRPKVTSDLLAKLTNWYFMDVIESVKTTGQPNRFERYQEYRFMDINCLTGDTELRLMNGKSTSIKELVGVDEFYVYSFDLETNKVVTGRGHSARLIGEKVPVYEVLLDNGKKIKATEHHPWLMKDGVYKRTNQLQLDAELMSDVSVSEIRINSVELIGEEDVYDITVDKYHNFALAAGVFVHNSVEIASSLDTYADECVQLGRTDNVIEVHCDDKVQKLYLENKIRQLRFGKRVRDMARGIAKYGDYPLAIETIPGRGVMDVEAIDAHKFTRREQKVSNMEQQLGLKSGYIPQGKEKFKLTEMRKVLVGYKIGQMYAEPWDAIHFRQFVSDTDFYPYGRATIEACRTTFRQLISCFTGDTKIALADGSDIRIDSLVGKKYFYVYSYDEEKGLCIGKGSSCKKTGEKVRVVKVKLDNREEIKCTPEHLFLLRTGEYKQAQYLDSGDKLMPLYKDVSDNIDKKYLKGYETVYNPLDGNWEYTHELSDRYNLDEGIYEKDKGYYRHHVDFNKRNNNPDNIMRYRKEEHLSIHGNTKDVVKTWWANMADDVKSSICNKIRKARINNWKDEDYKAMMLAALKKRDRDYKEEYKELGTRNIKYLLREQGRDESGIIVDKVKYEKYCKFQSRNMSKHQDDKQRSIILKLAYLIRQNDLDLDDWDNSIVELLRMFKVDRWQVRKLEHIDKYYGSINNLKEMMVDSVEVDEGSVDKRKEEIDSTRESFLKMRFGKYYDEINKAASIRMSSKNNSGEMERGKLLKLYQLMIDNSLDVNDWDNSVKRLKEVGIVNQGFIRYKSNVDKYYGSIDSLESSYLNHEVVGVEDCGYEDVYDFEVEKYHNFALSSGVIVHNSEILMALSRAHRFDRMWYEVKTGQTDPEKAFEVVNKLRQHHDENVAYNQDYVFKNPVGLLENLWTSDNVQVKRLGTSPNLADIADIEYLYRKLLTGLRLPKSYLLADESFGYREGTLVRQDIKFGRLIYQIQSSILEGLILLLKIDMLASGKDEEFNINAFALSMPFPAPRLGMEEAEVKKEQYTNALGILSQIQDILGIKKMTPDVLKAILVRYAQLNEEEVDYLITHLKKVELEKKKTGKNGNGDVDGDLGLEFIPPEGEEGAGEEMPKPEDITGEGEEEGGAEETPETKLFNSKRGFSLSEMLYNERHVVRDVYADNKLVVSGTKESKKALMERMKATKR